MDFSPIFNGELTFEPGQVQATISVPVLGDLEPEGEESMNLELTSANLAELGRSLASGTILDNDGGIEDLLANQPLRFTVDGRPVTIVLSGAGNGQVIRSGEDDPILSIRLEDTTPRTNLRIIGGNRNEPIEVPTIIADGPVNVIQGVFVNLTERLEVGGALRSLRLLDVTGGQVNIDIGGDSTDTPGQFVFNEVSDLSFESESPVWNFQAGSWTDTDEARDRFAAPWVNRMVLNGVFEADVELSGQDALNDRALNVFVVGRAVGNQIQVDSGDINLMRANEGFTDGFSLVADDQTQLRTFVSVGPSDIDQLQVGEVLTMNILGPLDANITATQVRNLLLGRSLSDQVRISLTAEQIVGQLVSRGDLVDSQIDLTTTPEGEQSVRVIRVVGETRDVTVEAQGGAQAVVLIRPVDQSTFDFGGDVGQFQVSRQLSGSSLSVGGDIANLTMAREVTQTSVEVGGENRVLRALRGAQELNFQASRLVSGIINGDLVDSELRLTEPPAGGNNDFTLRVLRINGEARNSLIDVEGNINLVTAFRFIDSQLYAGGDPDAVAEDPFPTASDFVTDGTSAVINNFSLRFNREGSFIGSVLAASDIVRANLQQVQLDNDGEPFGVVTTAVRPTFFARDVADNRVLDLLNDDLMDFELREVIG
jgi:hypothetical protein